MRPQAGGAPLDILFLTEKKRAFTSQSSAYSSERYS